MKIKTKYASYCNSSIPKGCEFCVSGRKLVLFVSGKCERGCWYCSLSHKRKEERESWANERKIKNTGELIEEAEESNSQGAGITGGDPLLCFGKTLKYARALKKRFGRKFHIHIYLPTKNVTSEKLEKLSESVDEVRFHPDIINKNNAELEKEAEKIRLAGKFWKKESIGIEMPIIPENKEKLLEFILLLKSNIGFLNLNEFEISETNFNIVTKKYKLNKDSYTVSGSVAAGLWILKQAKKRRIKIKIHICTAETKNLYQFKNRLKRHKILPYGFRTGEGTVVYLAVYAENKKEINKLINKAKSNSIRYYYDANKNRLILSEKAAFKLLKSGYKVERVEEFPTFDKIEVERGLL